MGATEKKKTLVRFNIQNIRYAVMGANGTYGDFKSYGHTAKKMSLENDSSSKKIYGDGKIIAVLNNERGKTGAMTTNNVSEDYEIDMGRKVRTETGVADIKPTKSVKHAIYFETCGLDENGGMPLSKTVLYGVTSSRPNESFDQNTDDINESPFATGLDISGTNLLTSDGKNAVDENGNEIIAWQLTVTPEDKGFEDFGKTVVLPKLPAQTADVLAAKSDSPVAENQKAKEKTA